MQGSILFSSRKDAAEQMIEMLPLSQMKKENWVILAVTRDGLDIALAIKEKTALEINIILTEPIMAPNNNECEIARVSETEEIVIHEGLVKQFRIQNDYIYGEAHRKHEEKILSQVYRFRKGEQICDLENKNVLLVDAGASSGLLIQTAIKTVMSLGVRHVRVAIPVMPLDLFETVSTQVDEIFSLYKPEDFTQTEHYYEEEESLSDDMVEKLLQF